MDDLNDETDILEDPQESRELSDGCDGYSSGISGLGFNLKHGIGDEGSGAIRRALELYTRFQEVEFPAIASILEANKQVQTIARAFAQSDSARQLSSLQKTLITPEAGKARGISLMSLR